MRNTLVVFFAAVCAAPAAFATPPDPPPIEIHRLQGSITLDGKLDDSGWQTAAKIGQWYETQPGDNVPPKVKTDAWITYDDHYFYIGIRCEDPHPNQIRAPYVERDAIIGTDDNIAVFIDTRGDKRSAMELRVSPRGIQGDAIFNDSNQNEDFSPDFFYDTAATIDATGWSAEYRIPFSSLRYSDAPVQKWNIFIWRNYPREFRYALYSVPAPRDANCFLCHMQPIAGLTGLPKAGHLVAAPYVTAQQVERPEGDLGTPLVRDPFKKDAGLDVKWTPSQNQAVDLTLNPDFSQVEADVAQITVNQRFAVFFPEKRPFFLEGFDLFDTPLQVAYTRTITAPRWGARSTGNIAGTAYTVLVTDDKGGGLTILPGPLGNDFAPQDFKSYDTIGRVRHDIGSSFVGGVFTDREISGGGHNRVIGPDFQWRPNQSDSVIGEALLSDNSNPDRPDLSPSWNGESTRGHAVYGAWFHQARSWDSGVEGKDISDNFRADLGFLPQNGYREMDASAGLRFFPTNSLFSFVRPNIFTDYQRDQHGRTIYRLVSPGIFVQGKKNLGASINFRPKEQTLVGGKLLQQTYSQYFFQIDPSRRFTRIVVNGRIGQFIDFANARVGHGGNIGVDTTVRPIDQLTLEGIVNREWLDAAGGRVYTAQIERLRALYSFSAKSIVRVIGQYVKTNRDPSRYIFPVPQYSGSFLGSILYSYKVNWQTVLFVGYGDDRVLESTSADLLKLDRSVFFKVSYAIQR